ncbi:MAG: iron-containing alcohol dehydrogenase [Planctomycetota bacterium]|jgi:alcohol dehydrogenase|nr:iron-containing alcohol dehydrogenase [Planctomycetota bacterium]
MNFTYSLPVRIVFGRDKANDLGDVCAGLGLDNGLLVSDPVFAANGLAERIAAGSKGRLTDVFSSLSPNPDVAEVEECVKIVRANGHRFLVALGGGSSMDCAKAASVMAGAGLPVRRYHSEKEPIPGPGLPLIVVPTTAGTGSEVTNVAVLTDAAKGIKLPMASDHMYARLALIDPLLTLSVPPIVTASTGLDVLSHALEGFWSIHHQPICDAAAIYSAKLVFDHLPAAHRDGGDLEAREWMCVASVVAGLAFAHPKTAGSHGCSFILTNKYRLPHGEACAFTLDSLVEINCEADGERIATLARMVGFASPKEMAGRIRTMKREMGMRRTLAEAGIGLDELESLVEGCRNPNLLNNPVELTRERLLAMFRGLAGDRA